MSGWWRANRLWLAALPLCVAGAAAASSYNVKDNWYDVGLHHRVAEGPADRWLPVRQEYVDVVGRTSRSFEVRLTGLEETDEWPYWDDEPAAPPEGLRAVVAHLDWRAEPDQALRGCTLALVDGDGRRFEVTPVQTTDACTPPDAAGPELPFDEEGERPTGPPAGEAPRPASWSTDPVFLVPADAEVSELWVSWTPPDYASLRVP